MRGLPNPPQKSTLWTIAGDFELASVRRVAWWLQLGGCRCYRDSSGAKGCGVVRSRSVRPAGMRSLRLRAACGCHVCQDAREPQCTTTSPSLL